MCKSHFFQLKGYALYLGVRIHYLRLPLNTNGEYFLYTEFSKFQ